MGKVFDEINDDIRVWVEQQKMFFVATAPLSREGHINCSPKGLDTFRILGPHQVAYLDFTGSGAETIAHLRENQRMVLMFCAFEGPAKIVRFHGEGKFVLPGDSEFESIYSQFEPIRGTRSIILMDVKRVSDSCGYGVPKYEFIGQRTTAEKWSAQKSDEEICDYWVTRNSQSIDGLPALPLANGDEWRDNSG